MPLNNKQNKKFKVASLLVIIIIVMSLPVMRFVVHQNCLIRVNKTCSAAAEEGCTSNTNLHAEQWKSSFVCFPTYQFQLTHHPLLPGSKKALVLNFQADHQKRNA